MANKKLEIGDKLYERYWTGNVCMRTIKKIDKNIAIANDGVMFKIKTRMFGHRCIADRFSGGYGAWVNDKLMEQEYNNNNLKD